MTARNTRDASYQSFVRSVQTVIDSVEQSYWDLVYARANLAVKLEARDIARELNRITKIKIDVGSLAPIDIVQTEVGIATAEQDIITAEAVVGLAEDRLRRDLNYQAESPTTVRVDPHRRSRRPAAGVLRSRRGRADRAHAAARDHRPELHGGLEHAALRVLAEPDAAAARPRGGVREERPRRDVLRRLRHGPGPPVVSSDATGGTPPTSSSARTSRTGASGSCSPTRS